MHEGYQVDEPFRRRMAKQEVSEEDLVQYDEIAKAGRTHAATREERPQLTKNWFLIHTETTGGDNVLTGRHAI